MDEARPFDALVALCARLRGPEGCPWDREQSLESLKTYVVEEAYEVVDALSDPCPDKLRDELGDLLFHILFIADIARERGWFDIEDVCRSIHAKMVRRHPHVFGDVAVASSGEVVRNWESIKQQEREGSSALEGVPKQLPALLKALRITEKAAALGFDWERVNDVAAKLVEEVDELTAELNAAGGEERAVRIRDEFGDVLFVMANLARQIGVDPEAALQAANEKFTRRFMGMETLAARRGVRVESLSLGDLDALWEEVKKEEGRP